MVLQTSTEFVERTHSLLNQVRFQNFTFTVTVSSRGEIYMRGEYQDLDVYSRLKAMQYTRRWLLSPEMTDSEIVQTAFKCALTSMEHQTRENFTFQGHRIFGPHFDVYDLVKLASKRENAGGRGFVPNSADYRDEIR